MSGSYKKYDPVGTLGASGKKNLFMIVRDTKKWASL